MTAINTGVHEVPGVRLPLQTSYGSPSPHAVFMYSSTGGEGSVTLQLRDADDLDDKNGGLASVLARLQSEDATLSISYQDTEMLTEGSIDVLLGTGSLHSSVNGGTTATFDLFDSESGQDLTLSPQTFTSSTEAFINDNSDSLGVPGDADTVGSTEDTKSAADSSKLAVKKPRPKASSPNRQGPQQCQVCGKVFGNASALAKHKLTHSDERKYVCTMCGKAFKRQDHLNGHMLTHRNKKPYECKAEGCGKSYCDARSLRRHTENHHSTTNNAATPATPASTTSDDATPASSSSCIQYAPPPTTTVANSSSKVPPPPYSASTTTSSSATTTSPSVAKQPSQLQQLLASEPATLPTSTASTTIKASSNSQALNNDGLTKQQLDLIHQIMQQTQQQAAAHHKQQQQQHQQQQNTKTASSSSNHKTSGATKSKTWIQSSSVSGSKTNGGGTGGGAGHQSTAAATAAAAGTAGAVKQADPKPVECNLCHRKFKNIPALNGHMRLHGGYFKKDSESKKCEKKETSGPPLQTASISVRALIEEKIIQKRITNPQLATTTQSTQLTYTNAETNSTSRTAVAPQFPNTPPSNKDSDLNIKLSSFVMPAPPPVCISETKIRRHSDSEHFVPPRAPLDVQQEAVALAELLLKRSNKVAVKRASSDPGHQSPQPAQQLQLSFQVSHHPFHHYLQASPGDSYSLAGVSYQSEDGGYFSPSLQDDVLSVQDTMLLHGVDPAQLAESIQFQAASLLHDQTTAEQLQDIASLEDYQSAVQSPHFHQQSHHQDFLPVSLADFGSYAQQAIVTSASGSLASPIPKDLSGYQSTNSPLQHHYSNSPHASMSTHSPLPSPLTHHDSPGYTYPTPPASQEGQSPSFGHMVTSLPMTSPHSDGFGQTVISHGGHVPPVSSPLSAAFYTSTMSSSAAVEAALNEVLPGETIQNGCMLRNLYHPSPPPQSPLSSTPVPSPLSMSSVPASSSSVSSPLPSNAFSNNQTQINFPLSPHLQSQMMPNSEDPLLSSSPKDFGSRKKFDFGGIHSFKLVGNGMVDFGVANSGLTGIVVDSNGELKFFQATNHQQAKNIMVANSKNCSTLNASVVGNGGVFHRKSEDKVFGPRVTNKMMGSQYLQNNLHKCQRSKMQMTLDNMKEEADNDVFLSPTSIPASPAKSSRKRPRPESLYIPPHPHPTYTSRLRSPRLADAASPTPPYTPPPMLSPARSGQGLYWQAIAPNAFPQPWPSSTTINKGMCNGELSSSDDSQQGLYDAAPESDVNPHVNVGPEYQSTIPHWSPNREKINREPTYEHLLWDPGISKVCTDSEVEMYLEFACCAAVPGGGRNKEYALHLLHMCHGNIHEAMLKLMQPTPVLHPEHPLMVYRYAESDRWSAEEMDVFHQGLIKFGKDFRTIAQELGSKSIKQCVQFYYLWKKVCPEEYKRLRLIRRRQSADFFGRTDFDYDDLIKLEDQRQSIPANDVELVSTSSESRLFVCEYLDCSASFNSRAALNGHIRIHGGGGCGRSPTPDKRSSATPPTLGDILEEFPCKICGKVFNKVKSRSAHMKSHRPPDAEPKKPKVEHHKMESNDMTLGRVMAVTTSLRQP